MPNETNVLEKAGNLAAEKLKNIQAPAREKAEAEAKVAADAKVKADAEKAKDEGIKAAEAAAKVKEDERILVADDKTLSEPELSRKAELKEIKRKKEESPDEKIRRVQEASQKRIDEITSKLKDTEHKTASQIAKLEADLAELRRPKVEGDVQDRIEREESVRVAKYLQEDKAKPREHRREISEDELEEWYLEEPLKATRWVQKNEIRRADERKALEAEIKEEELRAKGKTGAEEFIAKQNLSRQKLFEKYPGVNPSPEVLAKHKGKSRDAIREALCEENEEFRLCTEIVAEDPKKYLETVNGPELLMAEMEKRLAGAAGDEGGSGKIVLSKDELNERVEEEIARRALVDGEGISSSGKGKLKVEDKNRGVKSALRLEQEKIAKKAGIPIEDLDKTIKRREGIPGAGQFNIEGVDEG